MNKLPLLALLFVGCVQVSNQRTEYQNHNNGTGGALSFYDLFARVTAVGATAEVGVYRAEAGAYDCASYDDPWAISTAGHSGSYDKCTFVGQHSPVEQLLEAKCEAPNCSAAIDGTTVRVTGSAPGAYAITVTARLADGTVHTDSSKFQVAFATADRIHLTCFDGKLCPGPNAVFPGAYFGWAASLSSAGRQVDGTVSASVEPAAVLELTLTDGAVAVRALRPGTAIVTLRFGTLELTQVVRVVAAEDALSGEVRLLSPSANTAYAGVTLGANNDVLGAAPVELEGAWVPLIAVWRLRDGSLALGGARQVTATAEGTEVRFDREDSPFDPLYFRFGDTTGCRSGRIGVAATIGTAKLEWSFNQVCR